MRSRMLPNPRGKVPDGIKQNYPEIEALIRATEARTRAEESVKSILRDIHALLEDLQVLTVDLSSNSERQILETKLGFQVVMQALRDIMNTLIIMTSDREGAEFVDANLSTLIARMEARIKYLEELGARDTMSGLTINTGGGSANVGQANAGDGEMGDANLGTRPLIDKEEIIEVIERRLRNGDVERADDALQQLAGDVLSSVVLSLATGPSAGLLSSLGVVIKLVGGKYRLIRKKE